MSPIKKKLLIKFRIDYKYDIYPMDYRLDSYLFIFSYCKPSSEIFEWDHTHQLCVLISDDFQLLYATHAEKNHPFT